MDELTDTQRNRTDQCPSCESSNTLVAHFADFDVFCDDCGTIFDVRSGEVVSLA